MELISSINGGSVWVHAIRDQSGFPDLPFDGKPYLCLLINFEVQTDRAFEDLFLRNLILSNCKYACCAGLRCDYWHDCIDEFAVELEIENPGVDPKQYHLMTTWHDNSEIAETLDFVFNWGLIEDKYPEQYLVLFLGENAEEEKRYIEGLKQYA